MIINNSQDIREGVVAIVSENIDKQFNENSNKKMMKNNRILEYSLPKTQPTKCSSSQKYAGLATYDDSYRKERGQRSMINSVNYGNTNTHNNSTIRNSAILNNNKYQILSLKNQKNTISCTSIKNKLNAISSSSSNFNHNPSLFHLSQNKNSKNNQSTFNKTTNSSNNNNNFTYIYQQQTNPQLQSFSPKTSIPVTSSQSLPIQNIKAQPQISQFVITINNKSDSKENSNININEHYFNHQEKDVYSNNNDNNDNSSNNNIMHAGINDDDGNVMMYTHRLDIDYGKLHQPQHQYVININNKIGNIDRVNMIQNKQNYQNSNNNSNINNNNSNTININNLITLKHSITKYNNNNNNTKLTQIEQQQIKQHRILTKSNSKHKNMCIINNNNDNFHINQMNQKSYMDQNGKLSYMKDCQHYEGDRMVSGLQGQGDDYGNRCSNDNEQIGSIRVNNYIQNIGNGNVNVNNGIVSANSSNNISNYTTVIVDNTQQQQQQQQHYVLTQQNIYSQTYHNIPQQPLSQKSQQLTLQTKTIVTSQPPLLPLLTQNKSYQNNIINTSINNINTNTNNNNIKNTSNKKQQSQKHPQYHCRIIKSYTPGQKMQIKIISYPDNAQYMKICGSNSIISNSNNNSNNKSNSNNNNSKNMSMSMSSWNNSNSNNSSGNKGNSSNRSIIKNINNNSHRISSIINSNNNKNNSNIYKNQ